MHYIIGTKIQIPTGSMTQQIKPGMTGAQIRALSTRSDASGGTIKKLFKPGVIYTLSRIYKQDEKIIYKFVSKDGDVVNAPFDSVFAAETFISELNGDDLPDYDHVYRNMTD